MLSEGGIGAARVLGREVDDSVVRVQPATNKLSRACCDVGAAAGGKESRCASASVNKPGTHRLNCSRELQALSVHSSIVPVC